MSEYDREAWIMKRLWLTRGLWRHRTKLTTLNNAHILNDIKFLVSIAENFHI